MSKEKEKQPAALNTRQTLALRWRPNDFSGVVGHDSVVASLKGAVEHGTIPNAIMFVGPSGVGKTTLSRMFARYVNCAEGTSCGKCESCKQMDAGNNPDYQEVNGAEAGGIDAIRSLISQASFRPRNRLRIIMIDEVHRMTLAAANALLKPLEEPPAQTLWVLATTEPEKIPNSSAVCGRCQMTRLDLPSEDDIIKRLKTVAKGEKFRWAKSSVLRDIAQASGGHVRDALQILEQVRNYTFTHKELTGVKLVKAIRSEGIKTIDGDVDKLAISTLFGLYTGDAGRVIRAVLDVAEPIPYANRLLQLSQFTMALTALGGNGKHPKIWWTPAFKALTAMLKDKKATPDVDMALDVHAGLTAMRSVMQRFEVDALHTMSSDLGKLALHINDTYFASEEDEED